MFDPYPGQALVTRQQVAKLLSMSGDTFRRFLEEDATFPRPIVMGSPAASNRVARQRWRKSDVLVWVMAQKPESEPRK